MDDNNQQMSVDETQLVTQQFSCMGTTDKDVLISQLQKLVGPGLGVSGAQFFLDMNNWNLPLAVGAYFDLITTDLNQEQTTPLLNIESTINNLNAQLIAESCDEECLIPLSTEFERKILIVNNGECGWPPGCLLRFKWGDEGVEWEVGGGGGRRWVGGGGMQQMGEEEQQPPSSQQLLLHFKSKQTPGRFSSCWQMCTPEGIYFGDELWLICNVGEDLSVDLAKKLEEMEC